MQQFKLKTQSGLLAQDRIQTPTKDCIENFLRSFSEVKASPTMKSVGQTKKFVTSARPVKDL